MFADACEKARAFTHPMLMAWQRADGECRTGVGSLVVLNRDGWFLSAWHISDVLAKLDAAVKANRDHESKVASVVSNHGLSKGQRKAALKSLGTLPGDAPLNWAVWWMRDGVRVVDQSFLQTADLMLGRLDPFDPSWVSEYPSFRDPAKNPIRQGTSLCRVGYPFDNVEVTCDAATGLFGFKQRILPVFPIEGIFTREVMLPQPTPTPPYRCMYLETSSPGLKGQSGGPIIDTAGNVWAIQSQTVNFPLGFDPPVPKDGHNSHTGGRKEYQFLNVGWGSHPETVVGFLRDKGISFKTAA